MIPPMEGGGGTRAPIKSKNRRKGGPSKAQHNRGRRETPPTGSSSGRGIGPPFRFRPGLSNAPVLSPLRPCFESIHSRGPDAVRVREVE